MNSGKEVYIYYYRDKDQGEIDLILEYDGELHPIEIKKLSNPNSAMIKNFKILSKSSLPVGQGAIVCMKDNIFALDSKTLIIPVWCL